MVGLHLRQTGKTFENPIKINFALDKKKLYLCLIQLNEKNYTKV